MKVLIDSDVYLDHVLQRTPFETDANDIFELLADGTFAAFVCALTPATVFYFTRKAKGIQGAYAAVSDILLTAGICAVDFGVLREAEQLEFSDYEDAVQCASAIAEGLDAIVTRNVKDFAKSPIPVYSPGDFLRILDAGSSEKEGDSRKAS